MKRFDTIPEQEGWFWFYGPSWDGQIELLSVVEIILRFDGRYAIGGDEFLDYGEYLVGPLEYPDPKWGGLGSNRKPHEGEYLVGPIEPPEGA